MILEQLFQRRGLGQVAGGHDQHGITLPPVLQGRGKNRGQRIAGILDKGDTLAGEEALCLQGVSDLGGVFPQVGRRHAGQAHFRLALGADQRGDHLLPLQRHAHRIAAIDQKPASIRFGPGEIAAGGRPRQLHGRAHRAEVAIRSVTIWSASIRISRR